MRTEAIIGAAMKVHSALGPGLLEKAYQACLAYELRKHGFEVQTEVELPVIYEAVSIDLGYRIDLLVNDLVIVELKCVASCTHRRSRDRMPAWEPSTITSPPSTPPIAPR